MSEQGPSSTPRSLDTTRAHIPSGDLAETSPAIPDLEIKRKFGSGGMGVVYEAWQITLQRRVALKMIVAPNATDEIRARFRQEAQAAARLSHSGIVQIYHIGECDGQPYLVLELVEEGASLA